MVSLNVKDGGSWKTPTGFYVKDAGSWKAVLSGYVKDGGSWKQFWGGTTTSVTASPTGTAITSVLGTVVVQGVASVNWEDNTVTNNNPSAVTLYNANYPVIPGTTTYTIYCTQWGEVPPFTLKAYIDGVVTSFSGFTEGSSTTVGVSAGQYMQWGIRTISGTGTFAVYVGVTLVDTFTLEVNGTA